MSDAPLRSLRDLHAVIEQVRPQLDAAVQAAAANVPAFARLLQAIDPAEREAQAAASRVLERAALLDGEWGAYAAHLHEQGTLYAHMEVSFEDWFSLLRPYRQVIEAKVLPESLVAERRVLSSMHLFLDRTMAALAHAYLATKEQLVRQTEARLDLYQQMFRQSPVAKLIYEWEAPPDLASFRLVAANGQASTITGGGAVERLGRTLGDASPQLMAMELPRRLAAAIDTRELQRWTARGLADNDARTFECQCFPMGPRTLGVLFEDVTERQEMAEALARHVRELERSNRDLDEFAYVASHDLKAPLRDIATLSSWIVEDAADVLPGASRRHLSTICERIARMERLLDDLLDYSRAARLSHAPEALDLHVVLSDVLAVVAPPARFDVTVTGDAPPIHAPRVPLELVLRNLIGNAVKHHHRGACRIDVGFSPRAEHVEISVRDDGPGIAPEFHDRVFRMFQTLRPRDEVEGSGMGLAIVKKVVEAHHGRVRLESIPGEGTTIRFTWPRSWQGA
ncbi:MAG: ATP-binding protein [Sandaracinaceae bacterium]|nr:ATP-binding protein [Sandaracinaceae bacterium]